MEELLSVFKKNGLDFHKDIGNFRYCPTGEPYQSVTSSGVKEHSLGKIETFKTQKDAFNGWEESIQNKIDNEVDDKSVVFWRRMPEMLFMKEPDPRLYFYSEGWRVYSRFIISSFPIVQDANYNKIKKGIEK